MKKKIAHFLGFAVAAVAIVIAQRMHGVSLLQSAIGIIASCIALGYHEPMRKATYLLMKTRQPIPVRSGVKIARLLFAVLMAIVLTCAMYVFAEMRSKLGLLAFGPTAAVFLLSIIWGFVRGGYDYFKEKYPHQTIFGGSHE